jgi:hypothetical protein
LDVLGSRSDITAAGNGGTLFVPSGLYLFSSGGIIVPKGVTIRGEWQRPVPGRAINGTIFLCTFDKGHDCVENNDYESGF